MKGKWRGKGHYEFLISCIAEVSEGIIQYSMYALVSRKILTTTGAVKVVKNINPHFKELLITNIQYIRRVK